MTTGVTCTVYVDGVRAADGTPGEDPGAPVILEDLAVTWGRADTMAQPEVDSCSFQVMDPEGGASLTSVYGTGRRVDVVARGLTYPDPSDETFANPGFELAAPVTWAAGVDARATRTTTRVRSGAYALAVAPLTPGTRASVILAPGELQPPATNPDAWDAIPSTAPGQTWAASVSVWVPRGASASVRAALFSGPYATAATPAGPTRVVEGDGTWQTVSVDLRVQDANGWLGLQLVLDPSGYRWQDVPADVAWNELDPALSWADAGTLYVDDVSVLAPATGSGRGVLVFSGRITDLSAAWDDSVGAPVAKVTAVGFTADLQNRLVGDEAWLVEDVELRAHRILDAAGLPIGITIDPTLHDVLLSYREPNLAGATGLLQEVATSVDGVLWHAVHQALGAYLLIEDPASRPALLTLVDQVGPPPVVVRRNLATNPSVEVDLQGWASYFAPTQSRSNEWAAAGSWSRKVVKTATTVQGHTYLQAVAPVGIAVGDTLTVGVTVMSPAAISVSVAARGAYVGTPSTQEGPHYGAGGSASVTLTPNVPRRVVITYTIPPLGPTQTALSSIGLQVVNNGAAVGTVIYADAVTIEKASTAADGSYFDGATPDTPTTDYAWTGTAHASTSTASTVQTHTIVIVPGDPEGSLDLSACMVLRDPVTWLQDVSDVVTRTAVTWQIQGVDDEGNPTTTEATELVVDAELEALYGTRNVSISTQLQAAADAQLVAQRVLARTSPTGWRADGLTVDDVDVAGTPEGIALVLDLLDGTSRIGVPIVLGDLPTWTPAGASAGVYLEGGAYRYVGGRWVLDLTVSSATGVGRSAAWVELDPAWSWNEFHPSISWNDLRGVSA